jgi:hypothetical protein
VRDDLLRFKLACAFDSAGINAKGAETGPPPSRMSHVETSIATLFVYCSHVSERSFEIKAVGS